MAGELSDRSRADHTGPETWVQPPEAMETGENQLYSVVPWPPRVCRDTCNNNNNNEFK